jgi:hypothetical protein
MAANLARGQIVLSMNPLRSLETTLAGLVEGVFGRLFRSEVRPIELARRLAREMDEHRTTSVSRVYAPNEYGVWLSPEDRSRFEGVEEDLLDELCAYLLEHARREDLMLVSAPQITFHTDEALALGEFGIQARLVRPEGHDEGRSDQPEEHGQTMIYSTSERVGGPVEASRARRNSRAMLLVGGRRVLLPPGGGVIGRGHECEVVLDDAGVSRRHAEVRPSGEGWTLTDLGSTNGVRVNNQIVRGPVGLALGDQIELGSTNIVFELR